MARTIGLTLALLCAVSIALAAPRTKSGNDHHKIRKSHKIHRSHKSHRHHKIRHKFHRHHKSHKTHTTHKTHHAHVSAPGHLLSPHLELRRDFATSPAYRYGKLSQAECEAELTNRRIRFQRETARGVMAPVRLAGPLHGVVFRSKLTEQARTASPHEIIDCRLVLALDDGAEILRRHNIVEVRHYSIYRLPSQSWPWHKPALRHLGALAIDAAKFITKDGSVLDVDKDYNGAIGARTCGEGASPRPSTAAARELRRILCELVERRFFNVVLTPNYNPPHKNHFHLEVTAGVQWFLVH